MDKIKRVRLNISGKVQGVTFRHSAKKKADSLDLSGMIRNEPNGDVYAEVEGDSKAVEDFINWCRRTGPPASPEQSSGSRWRAGPPAAEVSAVEVSLAEPKFREGFIIEV